MNKDRMQTILPRRQITVAFQTYKITTLKKKNNESNELLDN